MEERESIWAVPLPVLVLYRIVFSIPVISSVSVATWYEIRIRTSDGPIETFMAIGHGSSPFIVLSAGLTVVFVEGCTYLPNGQLKTAICGRAGRLNARKGPEGSARRTGDWGEAEGVRMLPDTEEVRRFLAGESEEYRYGPAH